MNVDAILIPASVIDEGEETREFLIRFLAWVRPVMGYRSRKNPFFKRLVTTKDGIFCRAASDTMKFASAGERAGQDRYRWVPLAEHPTADLFLAIVARHSPGLDASGVKIGEYVEGAASDAA